MKSLLPLLFLFASVTLAQGELIISSVAAYADPDIVPDNIKNECGLPEQQIELLKPFLKKAKIDFSIANDNEVPATGKFLKVEILNAISMGNAFMGHHKQVSIKATLFVDGQEKSSKSFVRDSMGGVGAGFKGSCSVLGRC